MAPKKPTSSKHSDPAVGGASKKNKNEDDVIEGITPIQIPEKFVSPCYWHAPASSTTTSGNKNIFSGWQGQVPKDFPTDSDSTFFGGGGATRSFDTSAIDSEENNNLISSSAIHIELPDHRTEREQRLDIPASIISRSTTTEDVAISRLDNVPLDSIPLDEFYSKLTETSFLKRESMLKKDQQRGRGDVETFLDGEAVDVPSQYKVMLDRIYNHLENLGSKDKGLELPAVRVQGAGRRTMWENFQEICSKLNRSSEDIRAYICNELTTTSRYDGENRLHIEMTRLTTAKLQRLVYDYAMSHVYCDSCRGFDTKLVRDTALRLDKIVCNKCESERAVEGTSGGFQAIVNRRGRIRARMGAT